MPSADWSEGTSGVADWSVPVVDWSLDEESDWLESTDVSEESEADPFSVVTGVTSNGIQPMPSR